MLPNRHIKKTTALALAFAAIAPATASAMPVGPDPSVATYPPPVTVVRVAAPVGGFDWGDAGIGAAGGLALSILGVGTAVALTDRHARHANQPAAPTN